jgi:hypothetical protein
VGDGTRSAAEVLARRDAARSSGQKDNHMYLWRRHVVEQARAAGSTGSYPYERVMRNAVRDEQTAIEDFTDGCQRHTHSMYPHFMFTDQAQRREEIYEQMAARVSRLGEKEESRAYERSSINQQHMLRAIQACDPYCWQPRSLRSCCQIVDAWTPVLATAANGELVCIVKRCAVSAHGCDADCAVALQLLKFHNAHPRPEASALWRVNKAAIFTHPSTCEGKTGGNRAAATAAREASATPMQYEDRCVLAGTKFQYQKEPAGDETNRTPEVRSSKDLTNQCGIAEERSVRIMLRMNELATELLVLVPGFDLEGTRTLTEGTKKINRKPVIGAISEAAEKGKAGASDSSYSQTCKKRHRKREQANKELLVHFDSAAAS